MRRLTVLALSGSATAGRTASSVSWVRAQPCTYPPTGAYGTPPHQTGAVEILAEYLWYQQNETTNMPGSGHRQYRRTRVLVMP